MEKIYDEIIAAVDSLSSVEIQDLLKDHIHLLDSLFLHVLNEVV